MHSGRQADRQTGRQTVRQADSQADRQIGRHTYTSLLVLVVAISMLETTTTAIGTVYAWKSYA